MASRAEAPHRVGEVEVDAVLQRARRRARRRPRASPPATRRRGARGCRTRGSGARGSSRARPRGSGRGSAGRPNSLRHPDAPVVAERLAHQRELRLEVVARRDARRVDLGEARVRHQRAAAVRPPDRGDVAVLGVRREEEDVAVPAGGEHDGVRRSASAICARDEVAGDDADGAAVLEHDVEHLGARVQLDVAEVHLALERLVRAEQELLAGLAPGVERPRHLRAAERAGVEQAAVLAGERHALGDALVDDVHAQLREAVDVRLARRGSRRP